MYLRRNGAERSRRRACNISISFFVSARLAFNISRKNGDRHFRVLTERYFAAATVRDWSRYCFGDMPVACLKAMQKLFALW